jgi:hypothetical protein
MMQITWSGKRVKTSHDHPPIPVRFPGWLAWLDGTEDRGMTIGCGSTEVEAVEDLLGQLFDQVSRTSAPPFRASRQRSMALPIPPGSSSEKAYEGQITGSGQP